MRLLLDTHAFLWWIGDDARLGGGARAAIADCGNEILFSVASAWEIAIKAGLGRLDAPHDLSGFLRTQLAENGFQMLPIGLVHAARVRDLPNIHRDPFDRLLVATAQVEGIPLISADTALGAYGIAIVW